MKNNFGLRKPFLRKNSEPFMSSVSRNESRDTTFDQSLCSDVGQDLSEKVSEIILYSGNVCFYVHWLCLLIRVILFYLAGRFQIN